MDKTEFFKFAQESDIRVTIDSYLAYKGGKESMQPQIDLLKQEISRLHEIITERNHELGMG